MSSNDEHNEKLKSMLGLALSGVDDVTRLTAAELIIDLLPPLHVGTTLSLIARLLNKTIGHECETCDPDNNPLIWSLRVIVKSGIYGGHGAIVSAFINNENDGKQDIESVVISDKNYALELLEDVYQNLLEHNVLEISDLKSSVEKVERLQSN